MLIKMLITFFLSGLIFNSLPQDKSSCCSTEKDVSFTSFSNDKEFRDSHQIPKDFVLENAKGKMIKFNVKDGEKANGYLIRSDEPNNKYIFIHNSSPPMACK